MISLGQAMVSLDLRDLFKDGVALRIGARAFDILELLIRHQGQLVSKEQILQRVWPDTVVEENNLQVHISALRKALGSDRDLIRTIPGRGYLLLGGEGGVVNEVAPEDARTTQGPPGVQGTRLPAGVALVGRASLLGELNAALGDQHALITLIGPGGVGKTSLAVELGRQRLDAPSSAVYFVALAEVEDPDGLLGAFFQALAVDACAADPLPFLIEHLTQRSGLIILDNCEHLIDQVASLVEAILRGAPNVRILATSREPLRIGGERSLQVPPLTLPEPDASRDAILSSDSAQVFLRHWRALDCQVATTSDAELDDYSIDLVGEVCRRLDGIPLALEMAAARACALGLYQLVESLDESMHLLSASLRTAPPRQQTLQASLSWSYRLLSRDECTVLRQLADLDGRFTLEQACNALQCATLARSCVMDCMVRLATKSLLMVTAQGPFRYYRMLAATRTCLRQGASAVWASEALNPDPRSLDRPASLANLQAARPVPLGPDGYHARHQRALAVGH
ncbi:ATP-binding protein [Pseudomonas abietaniphila]|uniref:ATP-binding protein n=1 Tax=Pseudomonas abietaniphila TaxID=89065 RepID=UPI0009E50360|nr:winged helix-turn-helix domain-containing protein [Pseudomonas abietaniphila]